MHLRRGAVAMALVAAALFAVAPEAAGARVTLAGPTVPIDTTGDTGYDTSLGLTASGNPVISYVDRSSDALRLAACSDPGCVAPPTITTLDQDPDDVGGDTSLAFSGSRVIVTYYAGNLDLSTGDLGLSTCVRPTCSSGPKTRVADRAGFTGLGTSLAVPASGVMAISYVSLGEGIVVLRCDTPTCKTGRTRTVVAGDAFGVPTGIALTSTGIPVVAYAAPAASCTSCAAGTRRAHRATSSRRPGPWARSGGRVA